MTRRKSWWRIVVGHCVWCVVVTGSAARLCADEQPATTQIDRVSAMPNSPEPYQMRDWTQVTRDYLDLAFDFERDGDHLPLVRWSETDPNMVSLPAYIGGPRDPEAINYLAAVVSGSLVGIDMRDFHGQDWVAMGENFFDADEGVYLNRLDSYTGRSFWYDVFPNVLFYQVNALYPENDGLNQQARSVALRWHAACEALGGKSEPLTVPNFDHTGIRLATMEPTERGWIEPEAAGGIAWLEYLAWLRFHDPRFLDAADWSIRALTDRPTEKSALYEVLLPYGVLAAARMNAEQGRDYDVARLMNDCFEPRGKPQARPGWGVLSDRWQGQDVHGLVGSATDGGGYAFAMNTYQWLGALIPVARYDTRYARDIGKWALNAANASRLFYPNAHDAEHQSNYAWSHEHDGNSAIAYEGIRKWKRGAALARADVETTHGRIVQGSYASTHFRRESPPELQVFEETVGEDAPFEHVWQVELPPTSKRWLVVAAKRIDGGHMGNAFQFSYADNPHGPFQPAFNVTGRNAPRVVELPAELQHTLYVKAESTDRTVGWSGQDQLAVDSIAVTYRTDVGPFAQGDKVVSFVALIDDSTVPIVLYRPATAATDLGLYGSSHVGILGGIIRRTNVERILQLDLLKTDYYHGVAFPSYLFYNPYDSEQVVDIEVGSDPVDIYDSVADEIVQANVKGKVGVKMPPDAARILVIAPAGKELRREGGKTFIDNIVVRYAN